MTEIPSSASVPRHQKLLGSVEYRNAVIQVLEQAQRLLGSNVQEALALEVTLLKLKL